MSINYPIFNVSHPPVNEIFFPNLFRDNNIFFDNASKERYYTHYHQMNYVDISGNVYKAIGVKEVSSWLRKALNLQRKYHILFESLDQYMTLDEVRTEYIACLNGFKLVQTREEYVDFANKCKSIKELL